MSKLAVIDSNIFIWGIKGYATEGQEGLKAKSAGLIRWLSDNDYKLLLPIPQLVELMSYVPVDEQSNILDFIDKRFILAPFDNLAASKCSELIHSILTIEELIEYRKAQKITKAKLKYDSMIVSTAIVRNVERIYTDDKDLVKFAGGQIDVKLLNDVPEYLSQSSIPL